MQLLMKLIISTGPVRPTNLVVADGDDIILQKKVWRGDVEKTIDEIFKTRYIEAVQFLEKNKYSEKLIDYVEKTYKGVEVL